MIAERELWRTGSAVCTQRQWQAIVLVYGQSMTYRRAGHEMNISEEAVAKLISRGLHNIRKELGGTTP